MAGTWRPCKQSELKDKDDLRGKQKGEGGQRACGSGSNGSEEAPGTQSKEATHIQPHTDGSRALPPSKRLL